MDEQQALNAPYTLRWNGRELRFAGVNQDVKAACVAACKLAAIREHEEYVALRFPGDDAKTLSEKADYQDRFEVSIRSGRYGWSGDALSQYRDKTTDGVRVFIQAILKAGGTPLTSDEVDQLSRDMDEHVQLILTLILWDAYNSPKVKRPAKIEALAARLSNLMTSSDCSSKSLSTSDLKTSAA